MRAWMRGVMCLAAALVAAACQMKGEPAPAANPYADSDGNWPAYGRTWNANHYSPLAEVNEQNVQRLGLAWSYDIDDKGSLYTSPVAVDGVLYFAVGLGKIYAMDARSGKLLWKYDAEVGKVAGMKMRWAWGCRGIAYYNGKIYFGTVDGRLIALKASDGSLVWSSQTTESPTDGRYITGAPWVFKGKVIIGHGGADFSPVRGYVTAYDAETGKQAWRFFLAPGDPAKGPDGAASDSVMPMAAKTWTGEWWKYGGGGTAWNAFAYDPKFNRIYIGTGNGAPYNGAIRSPQGGDNLFLSSIVAVDADTGKYAWHYQVDPGEVWDYNSTMDIELTDLNIGGKVRPVLMQAPKNGFFYIIDRETGKLLSAEKIVNVNWAEKIDMATGRPVENPGIRYMGGKGFFMMPGDAGAHNATAMSFNPKSGLVYIPAQEIGRYFTDKDIDARTWKPVQGRGYNTGVWSATPPAGTPPPKAFLLAWNPVQQKEVWRVPLSPAPGGGVTSTAGGLVMQGDFMGKFNIYSAGTGKLIWSYDGQAGISSQPITYTVDGKQYVTILTGYRGLFAAPWDYYTQKRRVLTFVLDGTAKLPPAEKTEKVFYDDPEFKVDPLRAKLGVDTFHRYFCSNCHGKNMEAGGMAPDLRTSPIPPSTADFNQVVHDGARQEMGMPQFGELTPEQLLDMQHYIVAVARAAKAGKPNPYPAPDLTQ